MSHHRLPENIRELSVEDPAIAADLVDLCCFESDRARGCLTVLICDSGGRMIQPVSIGEVPRRCPPGGGPALFGPLLELAADLGGGLVVSIGKPRGRVDDDDRQWHQTAIEQCRRADVRLFGCYLATLTRIIRLPDPKDEVALSC